MPKIIRVSLTPAQRSELRQWEQTPTLAGRLRDRCMMIRLSDCGQTIPMIAQTLALHEQTVRKHLTAFLSGGFAALADRPHPGRAPTVTRADLAALGQLLDSSAATGRTWTKPQLVAWLAQERGVQVTPQHLGVLLHREHFRWKRTQRSVRHLHQDPALQDAAMAALESLIL